MKIALTSAAAAAILAVATAVHAVPIHAGAPGATSRITQDTQSRTDSGGSLVERGIITALGQAIDGCFGGICTKLSENMFSKKSLRSASPQLWQEGKVDWSKIHRSSSMADQLIKSPRSPRERMRESAFQL